MEDKLLIAIRYMTASLVTITYKQKKLGIASQNASDEMRKLSPYLHKLGEVNAPH